MQPGRRPLRRAGAREEDGTGSTPLVLAAGVYYDDAGGGPTLPPGPVWTGLEAATPDGQDRRELDLHGGVLRRAWTTADGAAVHSLRFVSLTRPWVVGLRAEGPPGVLCAGPALLASRERADFEEGRRGHLVWARTRSAGGGGITAAACQHSRHDGSVPVKLPGLPARPVARHQLAPDREDVETEAEVTTILAAIDASAAAGRCCTRPAPWAGRCGARWSPTTSARTAWSPSACWPPAPASSCGWPPAGPPRRSAPP